MVCGQRWSADKGGLRTKVVCGQRRSADKGGQRVKLPVDKGGLCAKVVCKGGTYKFFLSSYNAFYSSVHGLHQGGRRKQLLCTLPITLYNAEQVAATVIVLYVQHCPGSEMYIFERGFQHSPVHWGISILKETVHGMPHG